MKCHNVTQRTQRMRDAAHARAENRKNDAWPALPRVDFINLQVKAFPPPLSL